MDPLALLHIIATSVAGEHVEVDAEPQDSGITIDSGEDAGEENEEVIEGEDKPEADAKPDDAPEGEDAPEIDPDDPEGFQKRLNEKHKQFKTAEREAEDLRQELELARSLLPKDERPEVPELPDPYGEDFEGKMLLYTEGVQKVAEYDARVASANQAHQDAVAAEQRRQGEALQLTLTTYTERGEKLGIKPDDLAVAGNAVAQMGISDALTQYILNDDQGPLITAYLARNPIELDALNKLNPMQGAVRIATVIRGKLKTPKGGSGAPEPPETLDGGGVQPSKRGPKGATFE